MISFELGFNFDFEEARHNLDILARQYTDLLTEYAEFSGGYRRYLETEYMLQIGRREYLIFQLQVQILQLKREIALYQAAKNHGSTIPPDTVNAIIEKEFAEYKTKLDASREKIKAAEKIHSSQKLSQQELDALRALYHKLVHKLHPDLNPDLPPHANSLWLQIVDAYKRLDLAELTLLADMVDDLLSSAEHPRAAVNSMRELLDRQAALNEKIIALRDRMEQERKLPPFCYDKLLDDPRALRAKQDDLDASRHQLELHIIDLTVIRDELRGRL